MNMKKLLVLCLASILAVASFCKNRWDEPISSYVPYIADRTYGDGLSFWKVEMERRGFSFLSSQEMSYMGHRAKKYGNKLMMAVCAPSLGCNDENPTFCKVECDRWGYVETIHFRLVWYNQPSDIAKVFQNEGYKLTHQSKKQEMNTVINKPYTVQLQTYEKTKGRYTFIANVEYLYDKRQGDGKYGALTNIDFSYTSMSDAEWNRIKKQEEEAKLAKIKRAEQLHYDSIKAGLMSLDKKPTDLPKLSVIYNDNLIDDILLSYVKNSDLGEYDTIYMRNRSGVDTLCYTHVNEEFEVKIDEKGICEVSNPHGFADLLSVTADAPARYHFKNIDKYIAIPHKYIITLKEPIRPMGFGTYECQVKYNKKSSSWEVVINKKTHEQVIKNKERVIEMVNSHPFFAKPQKKKYTITYYVVSSPCYLETNGKLQTPKDGSAGKGHGGSVMDQMWYGNTNKGLIATFVIPPRYIITEIKN